MTIGGLLQINNIPEIQAAHAILLLDDKYILQLRDNKPDISASGQWSFFGGMKKNEETPLEAVKREIEEELLIKPIFKYLWFTDYYDSFAKKSVRIFFSLLKM